MKTFAYVNPETNIVENVSIANDDWTSENWFEYSSTNIAGIGYSYSSDIGIFIPPKPYPSWILDSDNKWQSPVSMPTDGKMYSWNEESQTWVEVNGN